MGPLSIASGDVSCAVVPFRYQKRLWLTVVVKARFAFVQSGIARHVGTADLRSEERQFGGHPSRSIEDASDLAPYLPRCDVTFVGHAYPPGGSPLPAMSARLGLARDGRLVLDKVVHVFGDRGPAGPRPFDRMPLVYERAFGGPGEPNPVGKATPNLVDPADPRRPTSFAPISRLWLARRRLLGSIDPRALEAPIADIPDAMPWAYFQAAPPDQQVDHLRGDEWLLLDGLQSGSPRVQTRLPSARGVARVLQRSAGASTAERPVEMVCDTLAIDGEREAFALVWRGRVDVPGEEAALPSLVVAAALEVPGRDVDWARLWAQAPAPFARSAAPATSPPRATAPATTSAEAGQETVGLRPEQQATAAAKAAVPFPVAEAGDATVPWRVDATPWAGTPLSPAPAPAGEATLGAATAKREEAGTGTMALRPEQQGAAGHREVAPFPIQPAGASGPVATVPGAPWGPLTPPLRAPSAGEGTLSLGESASPPVPPPMAAPPPPMAAPPPPMAAPPPPMAAPPPPMAAPPPPMAAPPPPMAAPPPPMAAPPHLVEPPPEAPALPPIASPRADPRAVVAQVRPPGPAAPPPAPVLPSPAPGSPEALLAKLRAAGASERDVESLLRALKPPPPPPDDD
ncbi:DUF2169 domain-containing protein [Sorangium sp. So ce296]|uniref:DUF2169 family type VI secretion system accessory protein n=1 Tax=Sorangium sp. So ce296 TaxID=3133296 RepID=UPI003F5E86C7